MCAHIDVVPVVVRIDLMQPYEEKIEEQMCLAAENDVFMDNNAFCVRRFNLKREDQLLGNTQKQIRTYFCDQFGVGRRRPLYRFDQNETLCHAGTQIRLGAGQYKYTFFTDMQPYKPAPKFEDLRIADTQKIKNVVIDKETNIIDSHPFTEAQMRLTYGHLNNYSRAYTKAHKFASRGDVNLGVKMHGVDPSYEGALLRLFTPTDVHYFPIQWNVKGRTATVNLAGADKQVWKPRVHMQFLKNYLNIQ